MASIQIRPQLELYWECSRKDLRIIDHRGRVYTPAQARAMWENGDVTNWNRAFERLVMHDFDLVAARQSYDQ